MLPIEISIPRDDLTKMQQFAVRELPKAASKAAVIDRVLTALDLAAHRQAREARVRSGNQTRFRPRLEQLAPGASSNSGHGDAEPRWTGAEPPRPIYVRLPAMARNPRPPHYGPV